MRATLTAIAILAAVLAVPAHAGANDDAAVEAAKSWYGRMVSKPGPSQTPVAPLAVMVHAEANLKLTACKPFKAARVATAKQLSRFASCVAAVDRYASYPRMLPTSRWVIEPKAVGLTNAFYVGRSANEHRRWQQRITDQTRGTTIVLLSIRPGEGWGPMLDSYFAVGPGGDVQAIWMRVWFSEMEIDSPSL